MGAELDPCPWCGCKMRVWNAYPKEGAAWMIGAVHKGGTDHKPDCPLAMRGGITFGFFESREEAVRRWNARAGEDEHGR